MGDSEKVTKVISFRVHKNIVSWLDNAGRAFQSRGELLRLILMKAALEQVSHGGVSRLIINMLSRHEQRRMGDTVVIGVRTPLALASLIEDQARAREESVSEWAAFALLDWQREYGKFIADRDTSLIDESLQNYATNYRARVASLCSVYARKTDFSPVMAGARPRDDQEKPGTL